MQLFARSIAAITPWFARFAELGHTHADKPAAEQIRIIRPMGIACEQAMYAATCGVNTHKGGIFALGLVCFAAGRVKHATAESLCSEVSHLCRGLVARELAARSGQGDGRGAAVSAVWFNRRAGRSGKRFCYGACSAGAMERARAA